MRGKDDKLQESPTWNLCALEKAFGVMLGPALYVLTCFGRRERGCRVRNGGYFPHDLVLLGHESSVMNRK